LDSTLTITIPFYRGVDYLKLAVESVVLQRRGDWKLLVCDDGGVEAGAAELVASFGDPRIEYRCNPERLGMARNWNRCLDAATSTLVCLLHADDRLLPNYVELMLGLAERNPTATAYYCGAKVIDAAGRKRFSTADSVKLFFAPRGGGEGEGVLRGEDAVATLMAGNFIMCPTLCFRMPQLGTRRFASEWKQVQDLEFTTRLLMDGDTFAGTGEVAYAYRRHAEGATHQQSESFLRFDEEFALFDQIGERAEELGWPRAARIARAKRIVQLHLLYRGLRDLLRIRPAAALGKLRYLLEKRSQSTAPR
jgi:glycosyltransferase involved in cell wall biosynthesis